MSMVTVVGVQIDQAGADPEYMEQLTLSLRQELLALDVRSVEALGAGAVPEGTRGLDAAALGALVVSVSPAVGAVGRLISALVQWLRRGDVGRSIRVKIGDDELELTGASSKTQEHLIEGWIRAHALG